MKKSIFNIVLLCLILAMSACNKKQNQATTRYLINLDSLLDKNPQLVLDSLSVLGDKKQSRFNTAYSDLLLTIAQDKTCYEFASDSLINSSVDVFSHYKGKHPELYARSLLYQGIVRYRMGETDSAAHFPIKIAAEILKQTQDAENKYGILMCYFYLGEIHNQGSNHEVAYQCYQEAYKTAKETEKESYIYFTTYALFWNKLIENDVSGAEHYLNELADNLHTNKEYKYSLKNDSASFFSQKKNYQEALRLSLEELEELNPADTFALRAVHYSLADIYLQLDKPLSAYRHAKQAVMFIQDMHYAYNDLYYKKLGECAYEAGLYEEAYNAIQEAYRHHLDFIDKKTDKKVLELEKKYDYAKEKNKALKYKNRLLLSLVVVGLLGILLISGAAVWRIRKRQSEKELLLVRAENLNAELEKKNIETEKKYLLQLQKQSERELALTNYLLQQYQRKFRQHTAMKNFIADLAAIPSLAKPIQKKILEMQDTIKEDGCTDILQVDETTNRLIRQLRINEQVINLLEHSEMELLITLTLIPNTQQAADLLETSTNSLYVRKSNLKKKLQALGIELPEIFR